MPATFLANYLVVGGSPDPPTGRRSGGAVRRPPHNSKLKSRGLAPLAEPAACSSRSRHFAPVRQHGNVEGELRVAGKTPSQVDQEMLKRLEQRVAERRRYEEEMGWGEN